jgi:integrase
MSLKYSTTTADYLVWSEAMNLIRKLAKDGNYKMSLLIAIGCFTGLRISDILALRWNQILNVDEFTVIEKKTSKQRTLRLNLQLQKHIQECYEHIKPIGVKAPILVSQKGTIYTIQAINRISKDIKKKYRLKIKNFSCHSLRKTFGRQVYNMNSENSELALIKLMELFNHSNVAITKRYLGLRQEEILETYDVLSF